MTRTTSIAIHTLAFLFGYCLGWTAHEIADWGCSDPRYHASLRWGGVECRR